MTSQEIKKHITAHPFRPFYLHVSDGRRIPVVGRDFALVSPTGRLVDVYQPDDAHDILDVFLITGVSFDPPPPAPADPSPSGVSQA